MLRPMPLRAATLGITLLLGGLLVVAGPATASKPVSSRIAHAAPSGTTDSAILLSYTNTGAIPPCRFSIAQLHHALSSIDTYGTVYFADLPNAIRAALAQRASGACSASHQATSGSNLAPTGPAGGATLGLNPGPVTAATSAALPAPLVILALLAALFALLTLAMTTVRSRGWNPAWAAGVRHSCREAGYRVGGAWEGFVDWLRSGR